MMNQIHFEMAWFHFEMAWFHFEMAWFPDIPGNTTHGHILPHLIGSFRTALGYTTLHAPMFAQHTCHGRSTDVLQVFLNESRQVKHTTLSSMVGHSR
jgi:hypothetical protein